MANDMLAQYERRKNQTLAEWFAENMEEHAALVAQLETNEKKNG